MTTSTHPTVRDITVVIPVRNAELLIDDCLATVTAAGPAEVIVVDGRSTDGTRALLEKWDVTVLDDEGKGLPHARTIGVEAASTELVLMLDVDVEIPEGALTRLLAEFVAGDHVGLQFSQESVGGPGYWGRALADHHRTGRSRRWFGVNATLMERATVLAVGFDDDFQSGEDMEFRWRLSEKGSIAVSEDVSCVHKFAEDDFAFAKDQFLQDGLGLGRMMHKHRVRGLRLAVLPAAAAARGMVLSMVRLRPQWIPYYGAYCLYNYVGIVRGLRQPDVPIPAER